MQHGRDSAPVDVGHRMALGLREAPHHPGQEAQALDARVLLAGLEQGLHAQADAEERPILLQVLPGDRKPRGGHATLPLSVTTKKRLLHHVTNG